MENLGHFLIGIINMTYYGNFELCTRAPEGETGGVRECFVPPPFSVTRNKINILIQYLVLLAIYSCEIKSRLNIKLLSNSNFVIGYIIKEPLFYLSYPQSYQYHRLEDNGNEKIVMNPLTLK